MHQLKCAVVLLLAASAGYADVTVRYKSAVKPNPGMPAQIVEMMSKGLRASMPPESVLQVKGEKGYSTLGPFRSIVDMKAKQITVLDAEKQQFATAPVNDFSEQAGKVFTDMPAEARAALSSMKISSDSRITGRTTTILGIEAEEREATMSIEGPPIPNMPPGPMVKLVMQFWTAKAGQEEKNPALKELLQRKLWDFETMSPAAMMQAMFREMPGMGEGMTKFIESMRTANTVVLRTSASMWMPAMSIAVRAAARLLPSARNNRKAISHCCWASANRSST